MKITLVFALFGTCIFALPEQIGNVGQRTNRIADREFLLKQRAILKLFENINQLSSSPDLIKVAENYNLEGGVSDVSRPDVLNEFISLYRQGLLPRGEIFSPFYQPLLKQAIALFRVLYYAKDFDALYKLAAWARNNVNEGIYLYALSIAIVQREDTYGIVLPPIYEIYPYYFYNNEVIQTAQRYKQQYGEKIRNQQQNEVYVINANYSGWYLNLNAEQALSYYYEDIGINAYYYYYSIYYPFWLDGDEFNLKNDRRGEQFYFINQQILARLYLERLSNGLGEIPNIDLNNPVQSGYYPSLTYPNGLQFPIRPDNVLLRRRSDNDQSYSQSYNSSDIYELVKEYETRIRGAIDSGIVLSENGKLIRIYEKDDIELLGSLVEGNRDSPFLRYYGGFLYYARRLLGYSLNPLDEYKVVPSALEQIETTLRDPVYYQLIKRIVNLVERYKSYQGPYGYKDLVYDGVKIESIQVDRLLTYFDYFYSDLNNAVYYNNEELQNNILKIRARQYRLNNKGLNYIINVNSQVAGDAVVRVYLGPKYDQYGRYINIRDNRLNFVEIDTFLYKLQAGQNAIQRNSGQTKYLNDRSSIYDLIVAVEAALKGKKEFVLDGSEAYYGFPSRYLLPKGKIGGQAYQLYVIINPLIKGKDYPQSNGQYYYPRVGSGCKYLDGRPLGFPFNRPIDEANFNVPNSLLQDVIVYNKNYEDINASI